ncbi:MAG: hypothetical protein IPH97_14195 [Ignavibacteriales bacterium]|nr:hypothetical protein [Ignavibacteriales bacterium]
MFSVLFFIKAALILSALILVGILVFRKMRSKSKADEKFKHNIALLREEKLLIHCDKKLEKKRHNLLKKNKRLGDDTAQLIIKSKKLGISTGEMLLASKIKMSCE